MKMTNNFRKVDMMQSFNKQPRYQYVFILLAYSITELPSRKINKVIISWADGMIYHYIDYDWGNFVTKHYES